MNVLNFGIGALFLVIDFLLSFFRICYKKSLKNTNQKPFLITSFKLIT